jgi:hypothetical protein
MIGSYSGLSSYMKLPIKDFRLWKLSVVYPFLDMDAANFPAKGSQGS